MLWCVGSFSWFTDDPINYHIIANRVGKQFKSFAQHLEELFFPPRCIGCARITKVEQYDWRFLCRACFASIPLQSGAICSVCGRRFLFGKKGGFGIHSACKKECFYVLAAAAPYRFPLVRQIISRYKYNGVKELALPLSELLRAHLVGVGIPDLSIYSIAPVPLYEKRLRMRGFNQSLFLAEAVATALRLKVIGGNLVRIRNNKPQITMRDWDMRRKNVIECFRTRDASEIAGRNMIIVDDVSTSGATMSEAAKALKRAGARRIIGLVVARG